MIRATYDRSAHRLTVTGHGGTANEEGHDLLCAAASTLTYTLAAALVDLCAAGQISDPDARLRPGDACLHCRSSHASRGAVLLTFDTVARGFALLASRYPDHMSYEEVQETS